MTNLITNRNLSILNTLLALATIFVGLMWLITDYFDKEAFTNIFKVLCVSILIQIIGNSNLIVEVKYLITLIVLTLLPLIFIPFIVVDGPGKYFTVVSVFSALTVIVIYSKRFFKKSNKSMLDMAKLIWVFTIYGLMIFKLFFTHHNQSVFLTGVEIMAFLLLTAIFYIDGFKKGYILENKI